MSLSLVQCETVGCGRTFPPDKRGSGKRFCSPKCRDRTYNASNITHSVYPDLSRGAVGAINELKVAINLAERGFQVFRALSPSCHCDLAVLRNGRLLRIEVTTGSRLLKSGKIMRNKHNGDKYDILATVIGKTEIIYEPDL